MSLNAELLTEWEGRPFEYGTGDCVQFALACAEHYWDVDVTLPAYASERDYLRLLSASGSLEALVTERLGAPTSLSDILLGDPVLTSFPETGEMLGVADPPLLWIRNEHGFIPIELSLATRTWSCHKLSRS